jgi:hypothetical protein
MFNQTQGQILDGLLIGDAYIPPTQDLLYFGQCLKNRVYVEYVADQLGIPVERVHDRARKPDKRTGQVYECSELRSLSHPIFAQFRGRWYKDGKKVVPRDLQVSREFLLHWYLCDGSCSVNRNSGQMMLCTDAFVRDEVDYLRTLLETVGIASSVMTSNRLRVHQKSIQHFYEYIGECPVACMQHKWIPPENRVSKHCDLKPFHQQIFNLYTINGWSCSQIARKFETNYFSIRYILKSRYGIRFGKKPTPETTCREGVVAPSETARRAFPPGNEDTVRTAW